MKLINRKIEHIYEAGINNMVTLVSTRINEKNYVMTSSTVTEVSHDPPLLAFSICPDRFTYDRIKEKQAFAINILSVKQKYLAKACGSCSGMHLDKFEKFQIKYTLTDEGLPFIDNCLANISCKVIGMHQYGDHTIFLGKMLDARVYGQRKVRHLLLSDMNTRIIPVIPVILKFFYCFLKRRLKKPANSQAETKWGKKM